MNHERAGRIPTPGLKLPLMAGLLLSALALIPLDRPATATRKPQAFLSNLSTTLNDIQGLSPASSTGTTGLFTITGSGASTTNGDYVSAGTALDTTYRYFIEVPPGLGRLVVDVFDADVGLGGSAEATAGRDRDRGGFDTAVNYTLVHPSGATRTTLFSTGDDTSPVGADNNWLSLFDSTGDTVRDNFSTAAYNNNDGLAQWATNWIETNDDNNAGNGVIQITGGELRIRDDGDANPSTIQREVSLSGSSATFSFDFRTQNLEAGDQMRVEVSANGGGSWTTLETFTGSFASTSRSYDISAFIASNTRVRFIQVTGYSSTDSFLIDNLQVQENSIDAGHWELRVNMSSAVTVGDDINALGIRAHDGTAGAGGTELSMYVDSINGFGANPPASGTTSRSYTVYPFVVSGCTCSENDFDFDSTSGTIGSMTFNSRTGAFSQTFNSAALSSNDAWKRNTISGWTSDSSSTDYGIWTGNITINSYVVSGTPNGNYGDVYLGNFQAAANPPAANPTTNAFRVYLPTDSNTAPLKPYLTQVPTHVGGPNPPLVGQTTTVAVTVAITNPTSQPITFSASNLVTANIPGGGAVYAGSPQVTQGTVVSQPAINGTGNITWNPGTLAAGAFASLSYNVSVTPTSGGQRIPITATPASGNGTRAQYLDETGNSTQTRATFLFGPLCELAVTAGQPTAASARIGGRITTASGVAVAGATVVLSGDSSDRTITDSNGQYRFDNLAVDGFYTITPSRANYQFSPSSRALSLLRDTTDAVFTAVPTAESQNPLDGEDFFIRQQYLDFLGREPEQGGWLYWTDQISACTEDPDCRKARTIDVSAAFFRSDEFQQSGSYIYGLYVAGLGRQLSFAELSTDRAQMIGGPMLEQDKEIFARSFVRRAEFVNKYTNAMTPDKFVDAILLNLQASSNVDLSSRRNTLLQAYNNGTSLDDSRRLVLQMVVGDDEFNQAEFNRSFVLMQYFGYLQRDADEQGYEFWLDVINNREPNNYRGMVCAFVTSAEYQLRFSSVVSRNNGECGS